MSLFTTASGRLRAAWRIGLFYLTVLALVVVLGALSAIFGLPGGGPAVIFSSTALLAAALAASWWFAEKVEGFPTAALGLPLDRVAPAELGGGFLVGGGLIGLAVAALALTGAVTWHLEPGGIRPWALAGTLAGFTLFLFAAAWAEELLFRGYPLQAAAERIGGPWAVALTALLVAGVHGANPGLGEALADGVTMAEILPLVNLALAGVVLGLAYWRTYSLWFATGVHLGWNWVMGFAADLPVSGLEAETAGLALFDTPGWDAVVEGGRLWTGGAFGPEGGLAVTGASRVAVAWLATTDRLERSLRVRALDPLPDRRAGAPDGADADDGPAADGGGAPSPGEPGAGGPGEGAVGDGPTGGSP